MEHRTKLKTTQLFLLTFLKRKERQKKKERKTDYTNGPFLDQMGPSRKGRKTNKESCRDISVMLEHVLGFGFDHN